MSAAVWDSASTFATTDAQGTADWLLDVAVKEAIAHLRKPVGTPEYRRTRAALTLARAEASASRMLSRKPVAS